jgi:hypothetical protein
MASKPVMEVVGARKMRKELKAAGLDMADLREPHLKAAGVVARTAKGTAPRRSGKLGASVRAGASRTAGVVRAGSASVPYANPIHWGWHTRGIAAQPFLSDAATSTETVWVALYLEEMEDILDRVKGLA